MKKVFIGLVCFLLINLVNGQSPNLQWAKKIGGKGADVGTMILDTHGNIYTTGYFQDTADFDPSAGTFNLISNGQQDMFIAKYNSFGNFVWAKRIGSVGRESGTSITLDRFGNVLFTGYFQDTVDFDPGAGSFILSANTTALNKYDAFILKLDSAGNFVWAKSFVCSNYGNVNIDGISIDYQGNIYTAGSFMDTVDFDPGVGVYKLGKIGGISNLFMLKLNVSGNFVWAKRIGGTSGNIEGNVFGLDSFGNIYTSGYFEYSVDFDPGVGINTITPIGIRDAFILKSDSFGNFIWVKHFGGISSDIEAGAQMDSLGNIYMTGGFDLTVDFDPNTATQNLTAIGSFDIFILKLDKNGNFIWVKQIGGGKQDIGYGFAFDKLGSIYISGEFEGLVDFDPSINTYNLNSIGIMDGFFAKYDNLGNFIWAMGLGDASFYNTTNSLAIDAYNNLYSCGGFAGTIDFDPTTGVYNLTADGIGDIYITKINQTNTGFFETAGMLTVSIFPNPTNSSITISFSKSLDNTTIKVINLTGQTISEKQNLSGNQFTLDLSNHPQGIYFVEIHQPENIWRSKVAKE